MSAHVRQTSEAVTALRADGDSKYDLAEALRDKLAFTCDCCGYNPKVVCCCPICQGSCKAKTFAPAESQSKLAAKTDARRKRLATRVAAKTRATFATQATVDPNTPLGRAMGGANPQALNALPERARAAMGLTNTSAHVGLAGDASGGEMTGRPPDVTFNFARTCRRPCSQPTGAPAGWFSKRDPQPRWRPSTSRCARWTKTLGSA